MADPTIEFFGIPSTVTNLSARVRTLDGGAIIETVALAYVSDRWTGTVTEAAAKGVRCVYELLQNGTALDQFVRKVTDSTDTFTINSDVDAVDTLDEIDFGPLANIPADIAADLTAIKACADLIKAKTDLIGNVTFLVSTHLPDSRGTIHIKAGDRHAFVFTSDEEDVHPDFTGRTLRFGVKDANGVQHINTTNVVVNSGSGLQSVSIILTPDVTLALENVSAFYDIQVEYAADDIRTIFTGSVEVTRDYSGTASA